jgi:D-glycero-D-manno-heptose 1,7-bisphosphate phosphatase
MSPRLSQDGVVILDRDGTVVIDRGYLSDPAGLEFLPTVPEALRLLSSSGFRLVMMTNQSGVGRGLISLEQIAALNARMLEMVKGVGGTLTRIYFCPHVPDAHCSCRKPNLGLMERAAEELGFDPRKSIVVGDKPSDVEFGARAGARTILLSSDAGPDAHQPEPDAVASTLLEAAHLIATGVHAS